MEAITKAPTCSDATDLQLVQVGSNAVQRLLWQEDGMAGCSSRARRLLGHQHIPPPGRDKSSGEKQGVEKEDLERIKEPPAQPSTPR